MGVCSKAFSKLALWGFFSYPQVPNLTYVYRGVYCIRMVKERKPLFVSKKALEKLRSLSKERNCSMGDVVDTLLGITYEQAAPEERHET